MMKKERGGGGGGEITFSYERYVSSMPKEHFSLSAGFIERVVELNLNWKIMNF